MHCRSLWLQQYLCNIHKEAVKLSPNSAQKALGLCYTPAEALQFPVNPLRYHKHRETSLAQRAIPGHHVFHVL